MPEGRIIFSCLSLIRYWTNFDEDSFKAFVELKRALVTALVAITPDWSKPIEFMCSASDHFIGVVLGKKKGKIFHSTNYADKILVDAQLNCTTTEKKLLVVVFVFDKYGAYLVALK